jgi:hypothetical protein
MLSDVTTKDAYPLPRIDDSLEQMSGAKWFLTLDLCSGYWQLEVKPEDRHKTAFATRKGLFQFCQEIARMQDFAPFTPCRKATPARWETLHQTFKHILVHFILG